MQTHPDVLELIRADLRQRLAIETAQGLLNQPLSKLRLDDYKRLVQMVKEELDKALQPEFIVDRGGQN